MGKQLLHCQVTKAIHCTSLCCDLGTMTIITITNVRRFDGDTIDKRSKITFKASPGNVMDIDSQPDEIIDGTGCTIMPGLIDSKIDADASISSLHKFASHGITTVI